MSRLATAIVLALAATTANAQDTKSGQSHTPAVGSQTEHGRSYLTDECQVMVSGGDARR